VKRVVDLAGRRVGSGHPVVVVAEAGINHNGSLELARRMVDVAAQAGADALKFQAYHSEEFLTSRDLTYTYVSQGHSVTESQYDMFKRCEFGRKEFEVLREDCHRRGLLFFATATDVLARDMLLELGVPALKIGSDDLVHHPMLRDFASKGKPLILSTGMADLDEVERAVRTVEEAGGSELILLHCTSLYPTPDGHANILCINTLQRNFDCPVGYSDHTMGVSAAAGAVALGACLVERHFTLDRNLPGPDHSFSADPATLEALVRIIRAMEKHRGSPEVRPTAEEMEMRALARRSVVAKGPIPSGTILARSHFSYKRPGTGIPPMDEHLLVGRRTTRDLGEGDLITLEVLERS
jgi:N-acetylneuraminate synthase/N,N'-diacetyllegionaminate synthase